MTMGFTLWLCLCFTLSAFVYAYSFSSLQPLCHDHDKSALLQFKRSFRIDCSVSFDPYGDYTPTAKMKSWIDGPNADCCSWEGVECNEESGHVIGLNLACSCIFGTFPSNSTLFNLSHLRNLRLAYNDFNFSHIPSEIGRLHKLRVLSLFDSSFSGQVPAEISKLTDLSLLELGDIGSISNLKLGDCSLANLVQNLTLLQELYFENVDISSTVPTILTNITSLRSVFLPFCNLYGKLPSELFYLPQLEILILTGNQNLYGSLPEFTWHSPLRQLVLCGTSLSGELPTSISRLAHLEYLILSVSNFSGSIPSSLGNLTKLTTLDLKANSFSGIIPPSLSNLTSIEYLDLSELAVELEEFVSQLASLHNLDSLGLSGMTLGTNLPSFLSNQTRLTCLKLSNSHGGGPVPQWLANLTQLEMLNLNGYQLEGSIPQWFAQLTNLHYLDLSGNNLAGSFEIFYSFRNLQTLVLSGVNLSFPQNVDTKSSFYQLTVLDLASCNLKEFPWFLQYQNDLQDLDLSQNHIRGSIPQWFVNVTRGSLSSLDLSANYLTGFEQPLPVLPWTDMILLDIGGNKFQGRLPQPLPSMEVYDASNNQFTGDIPKQLCIAKSLVKLDLSNNSLSGLIPHCITAQLGDSLQILNLRGNYFHGHVPSNFTTACRIKMINLSENRLEGTLPRSLANCTKLQVLDIGKNSVNDTFPSWLQSMPNLEVLVLRNNFFHGSITEQRSKPCFQSLRVIDMSGNLLTGNLPTGYLQNWQKMMVSKEDQFDSSHTKFTHFFPVGKSSQANSYSITYEYTITITNKGTERLYPKILDVFRVIDFSSNKFSGKIPNIIGALKGLQALNLSNNNLEGRIPPSLANMTDLESLDLSRNMLSGAIPPQLSQLISLEVFDVSYNHLKGPIPQGNQFDTFDNSSYEGNLGLCGSPSSVKCGKADGLESPMTSDESEEHLEFIDWIVISMGCLNGFIIGFVIGKLCITDRYHEWFMDTFQRKPRRRVRRTTRQRG